MLQSCTSQFICQWENESGGVPIRIEHLLHSSAVRYGEIFHEPNADSCNKSYLILEVKCITGRTLTLFNPHTLLLTSALRC